MAVSWWMMAWGFGYCVGVEGVEDEWRGSECADAVGVGWVAEGSDDLVLLGDEEGDEVLADGSGCAG
jgi:hypothetical protein